MLKNAGQQQQRVIAMNNNDGRRMEHDDASEGDQQPLKKRRLSHSLPMEGCECNRATLAVGEQQQQEEEEEEHNDNYNNDDCPLTPPHHDLFSIVSFQSGDLTEEGSTAGMTTIQEDEASAAAEFALFEELGSLLSEQVSHNNDTVQNSKLFQIPDDLLAHIGSYLNVGSLKGSRLVCRKFCRVLSRDDAGWTAHCHRLWQRKIHVSRDATQQLEEEQQEQAPSPIPLLPPLPSTSSIFQPCAQQHPPHQEEPSSRAIEAYRSSCMDARLRHEITLDELLYDPDAGRTNVWDFRFKEAAGLEWTIYDPYYAGLSARKMVFLPDGTVRQLVQEVVLNVDDLTQSQTMTRLVLPFYDNGTTEPNDGVDITWRFVSQPLDLPHKATGAYIRLTVGGREVPTYVVHRSPTGNWGFLMENCWGVFASFTLPPRQLENTSPFLLDMILPRNQGHGNLASLNDDEESSSLNREVARPDSSSSGEILFRKRDLLEDASLSVTNRWQWREALLYNIGSATLPDGPAATDDFDRAWQNAVQRMQSVGFSMEHIYHRLRLV